MTETTERRRTSLERVVERVAVASVAERFALWLAVIAPSLALVVAAAGDAHGMAGPAFGASIGSGFSVYFRNKRYLRLTRAQRRMVWEVQMTGTPTGDPQLDRTASNRLESAQKSFASDRALLPVLFAAALVGAVYAARRSQAVWFIAAVPALAVLAIAAAWRLAYDPRPHLAALRDRTEPPPNRPRPKPYP